MPPPTANGGTHSACEDLPVLSLKPPIPSATPLTLDDALFRRPGATLQSVADQLTGALNGAKYAEWGFYCIPNGFALATAVERISEDKRPLPENSRWTVGRVPLLTLRDGFSVQRLVQALFNADPGRYRMIVFYVTDRSISPTNDPPSDDWRNLPTSGPNALPADFKDIPFGPNHRVRAFVYEFRRPSISSSAQFVRPSLPVRIHLTRAGIMSRLRP